MSNMIRDLASSSVVTTRDFFAAEAMSAILNGMARAGTQPEPDDMKAVAQAAYMAADAMIEVRRETLALDPLRSAAPDLLEAAQAVEEWWVCEAKDDFPDTPPPPIARLLAAIARAETARSEP